MLSLVDLGFHELGHLVGYALPWELVTAALGSVAQIAVPLGLSAYFLFLRHERVSAAVCIAWAATSAWGVHAYIADAPFERLDLIGGDHDWAFILHDLDQMGAAAGLARLVWVFGLGCLATGLALCIAEASFIPPAAPGTRGSAGRTSIDGWHNGRDRLDTHRDS